MDAPSEPARRVAVTLEQCWHRVPGGTAVSAVELFRAWGPRARRWEPIGVSARHDAPPPVAFRPSIRVAQLKLPRLALYETWHHFRRPPVERATGPVDVIHATGVAMPPPSAPIVLTGHDLAFLRFPDRFTRHGLRFFNDALRLAKRDAALVLCVSTATLDDYAAEGFERSRLRLVPHGVRPVAVSDDDVAGVRSTFELGGPYVLSVGTLEPRKNLPGLLEAFAALERRDLTLVVAGPAGWGEALEPLAARLGDRVRLTGFVSEAQKAALYKGAAVFCYPSFWEGFGLPVLEAMAQGCPVVTSAGTATEETAGGAAVLVDPHDTAALTAALARVLDDEAHAGALRGRGLARARECTWERTADLVAAAYDEVRR
jgi:glycosyltransferase involved in cell wall biosynthesis